MQRISASTFVAALGFAGTALAYDSLASQLPSKAPLSRIFRTGKAHAEVVDGPLHGRGQVHTTLLKDGRLRIERTRTYHALRDPETGRVGKLPQRWRTRTRLLVSPALRLLRADTRLSFHKSADGITGDYRISEDRPDLFEMDRIRVFASADTRQLTRVHHLRKREVERVTYEYAPDAIPIEIISQGLAAAVHQRVHQFDFDLLLPDGSTHGVRSRVHRTRDATKFAEGYRLPRRRLRRSEEVAVVEMRLASPVKYLFFPHRFYMVYASADPGRLLALWGGDPDEDLRAFRVD